MDKHASDNKAPRRSGGAGRWALGAAALCAAWLVVRGKRRQAESAHPPTGDFIDVNGVRQHYLSQGEGPVVLLLHGNGVIAEDFRHAGLLGQLAANHRVIAFDRPGFGYSERPRGTWWTPAAQAALLAAALDQLGVERAVVLAHSWATLVAISLGLQRPQLVQALVLASGYYYPSVRLDVLTATPAIPLVGDVLAHTVSPLLGRLLWPLAIRRAFAPSPVPDSFRRLSPWMALRPRQLRAEAEETAMMIPSAAMLQAHYPQLRMPVAIVAGDADAIASAKHNSVRLQRDIDGSELTLLPGEGHMIQHLSQQALVEAVERLEREMEEPESEAAGFFGHQGNGAMQPGAAGQAYTKT
ncbi:alpha/beta fold hydrolase [Janthinobacterium psychrotolerans]|uniref:Pimeloyl-ACP methyl ester carboxylesterase n=1 Tax=Janthinobacterium psychrotolerans TaxID=1747903 RepID=A0A1A7BX84_9BURK|nr:alpha/beta hydrolase [Janthinobacterium psychrotolerans]OBV36738.1 Pimeloyl-ACP methyl ester carboxylesterase [Janthinobacterium psychrotolerans]